jgi:hypothetical protein
VEFVFNYQMPQFSVVVTVKAPVGREYPDIWYKSGRSLEAGNKPILPILHLQGRTPMKFNLVVININHPGRELASCRNPCPIRFAESASRSVAEVTALQTASSGQNWEKMDLWLDCWQNQRLCC